MDIRSKILFAAFILAGLLSASVLYVSARPGLAGTFVRKDISGYGELFNMCRVEGFGERLAEPSAPLSERPPEHDINEAEAVFIGDSFIGSYGWYVGMVFERRTGMKSFSYHGTKSGVHEVPTDTLKRLGLSKGSPLRYVVMVHTERFNIIGPMYDVMRNTLKEHGIKPAGRAMAGRGGNSGPGWFDGLDKGMKAFLVDKKALEYLVTENRPVHEALVLRNTFRFETFGEIDKKTPVYSKDPPMLHYFMDVLSDRKKVKPAYYSDVADYMKLLSDEIRDEYGARLVVMIVPSKYTLLGYDYDRYAYNTSGESYNGFVPRLNGELAARGVLYVDLYKTYEGRGEEIYEPHHSHWKFEGMDMASGELYKVIKSTEADRQP